MPCDVIVKPCAGEGGQVWFALHMAYLLVAVGPQPPPRQRCSGHKIWLAFGFQERLNRGFNISRHDTFHSQFRANGAERTSPRVKRSGPRARVPCIVNHAQFLKPLDKLGNDDLTQFEIGAMVPRRARPGAIVRRSHRTD